MTHNSIKIRNIYRIFFLILISFLLINNLLMGILMGNFEALLPASINIILLYLLWINHSQLKVALLSWAWIYLLLLTGIMVGAKTLVIIGGNGWEINTFRYRMDIFMVALGVFIIIFNKKIFLRK